MDKGAGGKEGGEPGNRKPISYPERETLQTAGASCFTPLIRRILLKIPRPRWKPFYEWLYRGTAGKGKSGFLQILSFTCVPKTESRNGFPHVTKRLKDGRGTSGASWTGNAFRREED